MKKLILITLLLTASIECLYGQVGNEIISHKDSIALTKEWNTFKKKLFLKDIHSLKLLSCKIVSGQCILEPIHDNCNSFCSPSKLLGFFFKEMFPQERQVILKDRYKIVVYSSIKDEAMKIKYPKEFQIWFRDYSEPGSDFAFIFIKVDGRFKFYGLDEIP